MGCFTDTDVTVLKQLQKEYSVHWYVLHQPHDPYPVPFYADFVKNIEVITYKPDFRDEVI